MLSAMLEMPTIKSDSLSPKDGQEQTGVRSLFLRPRPALTLAPSAGTPSMSTTITSLTPVFVTHPYMASLSSNACSRPKSCVRPFVGIRASKMSRQELSINEYSSLSRSASYPIPMAGKSEICNGLLFLPMMPMQATDGLLLSIAETFSSRKLATEFPSVVFPC